MRPSGAVTCVDLDGSGQMAAVAVDKCIYICYTHRSECSFILEERSSVVAIRMVSLAESTQLLTATESGTIGIWDLASGTKCPEVLSLGVSIRCLTLCQVDPSRFYVGTLQGMILAGYLSRQGPATTQLIPLQLWEVQSSLVTGPGKSATSPEVLGLLARGPLLLGSRLGSCLLLNAQRGELMLELDQDVLLPPEQSAIATAAGSDAAWDGLHGGGVRLVRTSGFGGKVQGLWVPPWIGEEQGIGDSGSLSLSVCEPALRGLSMLPSGPLPKKSALLLEPWPEPSSSSSFTREGASLSRSGRSTSGSGVGGRKTPTTHGRGSSKTDQPLTFHKKIASSGYGSQPPVMKLFSGGPAAQAKERERKKKAAAAAAAADGKGRWQVSYPEGSAFPSAPVLKGIPSFEVPLTALAITPQLSATTGHPSLLLGAASGALWYVHRPSKGASGAVVRPLLHQSKGRIRSCAFSLQTSLAASGGEDGLLNLWDMASGGEEQSSSKSSLRQQHGNLLLSIPSSPSSGAITSSTTSVTSTASTATSSTLHPAIKSVRFFYVDRFVAAAHSSQVTLHRYQIDREVVHDAQRYQPKHKHKCLMTHHSDSSVVALDCINAFYSPLLLLGTASKRVDVWDAGSNTVVRSMENCHSRAIHSMVCAPASPFATHPPASYDLFLSASVDGVVRMWDLRADRLCREFKGAHVNRSHTIGVAWSCDMRYVAVGSEDGSIIAYEAGSGKSILRISGHRDAVTGLVFDPARPILCSASLDGTLNTWTV
jgi:WD40 repeat protein